MFRYLTVIFKTVSSLPIQLHSFILSLSPEVLRCIFLLTDVESVCMVHLCNSWSVSHKYSNRVSFATFDGKISPGHLFILLLVDAPFWISHRITVGHFWFSLVYIIRRTCYVLRICFHWGGSVKGGQGGKTNLVWILIFLFYLYCCYHLPTKHFNHI